jgi:hypothetical protein
VGQQLTNYWDQPGYTVSILIPSSASFPSQQFISSSVSDPDPDPAADELSSKAEKIHII